MTQSEQSPCTRQPASRPTSAQESTRSVRSRAAYELAASPKWSVTLHGADHRLALTDETSPYDDLVTRTILDFWHGTLDGAAAALGQVTADG